MKMEKILEMEILNSQIESPQENIHIEDKMLMGPDNLYVNIEEEKVLESNQEEGQLEDYEDEVPEEEEKEEIIHDGQDVTDREEVSEYVDTEDEEESQDEEDLENMKEKKDLSNQQNLFLYPSNYGRNEAKCIIDKEKQVTNIPTEFPASVMRDIYGNFDANLYATSLKSPTESLPKGSARHMPAATDQTVKDSISMRQHEDVFYIPSFMNGSRNFKMDRLMDTRSTDIPVGNIDYLERHPNLKPIQLSIEMKDSFTNQEVEKAVKGNKKSNLMEEFGLDDADDIDDASDWDSTSTSQKNESYKSSKNLNFNMHYPCQSLPVTKNRSGSTGFGKIPLKEEEAAAAGSGPETGFRAVIPGDKPVPQEQCEAQLPLKKEEGKKELTQELEFKASSKESQEDFDKSDPEQDKVTLETANIPEQAASKKQVKPLSFPLSLKRMSQGPEPKKESNSGDVHLDADPNWEERYEKMWVDQEKMEVKKNFKIITTELKQIFGEIYEKDRIADQPTGKLQEEEPQYDFEEESKQLQEASPNLANNSSDTEEMKKYGGTLNVGVQPFPEQWEYSLENAVLQNLKLTFQENVLHSSSNLCSESSSLQHKNGNMPKIEYTCNLNEEDVAYDAENIKIANSQIAINEVKEDGAFGMQLAGSLNRNTTNLEPDSRHLLLCDHKQVILLL